MPYASVTLKPGVNTEWSPTLNSAGYSVSQLGRFRAGLFEKIGGWTKFYPFLLGGSPRAMHAWQDFNEVDRLAIGSTTNFGVITNSSAQSITPQTKTTDFAPKFTTTISSAVVTVDDSNIANVTTLDTIEFRTPVSVGGIILSGAYAIAVVTGTTTYRITAATVATASVTNGGTVPLFNTTSGSSAVSVTLAAHGLSAGNSIVFPLSTAVGGVTIQGTYIVSSVTSSSVFVIAASAAASSTTSASMNSGNAELVYYIALGPPSATGTGWGILGWGIPPWGGTGATPSAQTGTAITATDWSMDNWGQTILANPADGGIYAWTPNTGFQNLQLISSAPIYNGGIFVAAPYQILIAWGSTAEQSIGVDQDPLSYSWSDQADYTFWTPGVVNPATGNTSQAGNNRIPTGSAIKAGLNGPQQALLWTDLDLWAVNYIGNVSQGIIFGQTKLGANCGAISRHGVAQMGGVVYWWGRNNFYYLAGGQPQVIPCTVWDAVFQNIDTTNLDKCWIETVTAFSEVWFFYPSSSSSDGQCDSYAKVNILDGSWDYGSLPRSCGIDQSVLGKPIMATPQGLIYRHEDTYDGDGQPLVPLMRTGYFLIGDGEDYAFVDQFLPDFKFQVFSGTTTSALIQITFYVVDFLGDTPRAYGPYSMDASTNQLAVRFRGRQMAIEITSSDVGSWWRLQRCRYRFAVDGRR